MSDAMKPIPFEVLLDWMVEELTSKNSIFEYQREKIFHKNTASKITLFNEALHLPIGPAAGPHTQMAQNIIVAYLSGGRFFELKTVQKLDRLRIPRPCIEASDEGYNVEWSQELRIEQSLDEYLKAYFILHLLGAVLGEIQPGQQPGFIFNMSVGYDLAGIQSARMDWFINSLNDARRVESFHRYKQQLLRWLQNPAVIESLTVMNVTGQGALKERLMEVIENVAPTISNSVTVSTMHGCPPHEIHAICGYLLKEKRMHTFVKLNPTLLGFKEVKTLLEQTGYHYLELDEAAFEHDLQYNDALPMIENLQVLARQNERSFGVKLSNTLGLKNNLQRLPGDEMYMSGRALFPLTIHLAHRLARDFSGNIQISYSGGAALHNIGFILQTGIYPVTMVTDLLKPGGYARLQQMAETIEKENWSAWLDKQQVDVGRLAALAQNSVNDAHYQKERRAVEQIKIKKPLPLFDCYLAPCQEACPIHQDVARYIRLVEEERYLDAFKVILETNPLPHITGYICDHQCMYHCTRWDYEDPVYIREMKKVAAEQAWDAFLETYGEQLKPKKTNGVKVAVLGAGPAGLSAAYFLARAGFEVTVLEKEQEAGGVVRNVIPDFRLPQYAIERDFELVRRHGVQFRFGVQDVRVDRLQVRGFKYVFLAIGAGRSKRLPLNPCHGLLMDALEFLRRYKQQRPPKLGKRVAVIGGGNSAMDAARAARRLPEVEDVFIIYRRTKEFMPADKEEFEAALSEGVLFKELLLPVSFKDGTLICQKMRLGPMGADGRRTVQAIDNAFEELRVDAVISAIGEQVDQRILKESGIKLPERKESAVTVETNLQNVFIGGDALRGPSTVVESIADGKKAAEIIALKEKTDIPQLFDQEPLIDQQRLKEHIIQRKGQIVAPQEQALAEAARCLSCSFVCDKCVEVCPNRANVTIKVPVNGHFKDATQILHLDGLCNECGNCETFCPYLGRPYEDKITLFWSREDFESSSNDGFYLQEEGQQMQFVVRFQQITGNVTVNADGSLDVTQKSDQTGSFDLLLEMIKALVGDHRYLLGSVNNS